MVMSTTSTMCVHTHGDTLFYFILCTSGGQVVHSYGRLILHERVITDKQQLQPPNNDSGDGRIECRESSRGAMFTYHSPVSADTIQDVHQIRRGSKAIVVIRNRAFNNFENFEGKCAGIYHYLFLSNGEQCIVCVDNYLILNTATSMRCLTFYLCKYNMYICRYSSLCPEDCYHDNVPIRSWYHVYIILILGTLPDVSITGTTSTDTSITVNIGTIPSGFGRVIIGYHRLDLGVPVVGEYGNNYKIRSRTFSSLVPGAKYRITAWELGGSYDRRRSQSPAVREVTTMEQSELMGTLH